MADVLLHGLVLSNTAIPIDSPPHDLVVCAGITALISAAPLGVRDLEPEALAELALGHHAILQAYCETVAVLPLRFGSVFSSVDTVRHHIRKSVDQITIALHKLEDMKEYTLRLTVMGDPTPPSGPALTGRDFLARGRDLRKLRHTIADGRAALSRDLTAALHRLAVQIEPAAAARPDRVMDLAALLPAGAVASLATIAQRFGPQAQALGLDLRITGPWPAYSFKMPEPEVCNGA